MVLEVAHVSVLPGHEDAFVASLRQAADEVLPRAAGFVEFHAHGWCIERPNVYLFTQWRAHIGPHFDGAPTVEHFA